MKTISPIVQNIVDQVRALGIKGDLQQMNDHTLRIVKNRGNIAFYTTIEYVASTDTYDVIKEKMNFSNWEMVVDGIFEDVYFDNLKELAY